jgi:DNA-binding NtrC family response regulator
MARILIVEDEPLVSMMLEEWVVELGHIAVGPAQTVAEALHLISAGPIDAAIIDFHLRSETSVGVAQALNDKHVPFSFASGSTMDVQKTMGGAFCVLSKPYDFDTVQAAVASMVVKT